MTVKADSWILEKCEKEEMIKPFIDHQVKDGKISYGLSSYGYDIRLARAYKVYQGKEDQVIDPKNLKEELFESRESAEIIIPPNSFILGRSYEYFKIPRRVMAKCTGKSTYCRCGVIVNVSPLEPGWEGYLTISIANTTPSPVKLYAEEGIAQIVFHESDMDCRVSYDDRGGKYQAQKDVTLAKIS